MSLEIILKENDFLNFITFMKLSKSFVFKIIKEINQNTFKIFGIGFYIDSYHSYYIPIENLNHSKKIKILSKEFIFEKLRLIFQLKNLKKIGYDLKSDIKILKKNGIVLTDSLFDVKLESYLFNGKKEEIKSLSEKYFLNFSKIEKKISLKEIIKYTSKNMELILKLHIFFQKKLNFFQKKILKKIEIPLIKILLEMEENGVFFQKNILIDELNQIQKKLNRLENKIFKSSKKKFNINSYKEVKKNLINKNLFFKTMILKYRSLKKIKEMINNLLLKINLETNRIHTDYHQSITITGRISSRNPNLQNIPFRKKEGKNIRSAFSSNKNYQILTADYSQIELRILTHLSQDKNLLIFFQKENNDLHCYTASKIFNVEIENITEKQRQKAKIINYSLIYGISAFGLSKLLKIERKEAQKEIENYFSIFEGIKKFFEKTINFVRKKGFIETLLGRRIYIENINSNLFLKRSAAERTAMNAPMQANNSEIIKLSMISIHNWIQKKKLDIKIILQIHDEIVFEVPEELINESKIKIKKIMENILRLSILLKVKIGVGKNLKEASFLKE